jgi:hypothetical protein
MHGHAWRCRDMKGFPPALSLEHCGLTDRGSPID